MSTIAPMTNSTTSQNSTRKLSEDCSKTINSPIRSRKSKRSLERSDVLVSAVISTYLLTHLHQVLQRAEFGAAQEGRDSQAANFAKLRKLLCMDARSMEDASAKGIRDPEIDQFPQPKTRPNAA